MHNTLHIMIRKLTRFFGHLVLMLGLPGTGVGIAFADVRLPGPVVDVQWLHAHVSEVQVVDIRDDLNSLMDKPHYQNVRGQRQLDQVGGYIPDALSVNFWALRESREIQGKKVDFLMPTAEEFQAVMRASVLESGKPVILVPTGDDATSLQEASFLAWELQIFGMRPENIAILDGGTHAWITAGFEVESDGIAPMESGHWTAQEPQSGLIASIPEVQSTQSHHRALWDARPLAQFVGVDNTPAIPVRGRLEGAKALPAELLYSPAADGSWHFLQPSQYRAVFGLQGMARIDKGIIYCNTGQYAAGAWFVMTRILGRDGFRLYPGGMNEWTQQGLPVRSTLE